MFGLQMTRPVPLNTKSRILRYATAIDPRPLLRIASSAIGTVRRSLLRRWRDFLSPRQNVTASETHFTSVKENLKS
jgi:hypothetical protein